MRKLTTIVTQCAQAFPKEVIVFLENNEDSAKAIFRDAFVAAEGKLRQNKRWEETKKLENAEMQKCANQAWKTFFGDQPKQNLPQRVSALKETLENFRKEYDLLVDDEQLTSFLDSIVLPEKPDLVSNLFISNEKPRNLGYKRSPTMVRLEKTEGRRMLRLHEALFFIQQELALVEEELKRRKEGEYLCPEFTCFRIPISEQISTTEVPLRLFIKFEYQSLMQRIKLKVIYTRYQWKWDLDVLAVLAHDWWGPEARLLDSIFSPAEFTPTSEEYFKDLFKSKR